MRATKANSRSAPKKRVVKKNVAARLHDTVAQELTAATILAHVLAARLEKEKHPQTTNANALLEKLNLSAKQLQDIMLEFAPPLRKDGPN